MVDIESQVFTKIKSAVTSAYADADITSEEIRKPAKYPSISVIETDNYTDRFLQDSGNAECFANVVYEVNVYTNNESGKKSKAKAIMKLIDDEFFKMGFYRISTNPITMSDATLYRIVCRYRAKVDMNNKIYRS